MGVVEADRMGPQERNFELRSEEVECSCQVSVGGQGREEVPRSKGRACTKDLSQE